MTSPGPLPRGGEVTTVIQEAALAMGIEPPLFPSILHLTCIGCDEAIEGPAFQDDAGWLCENCAESCEDAP